MKNFRMITNICVLIFFSIMILMTSSCQKEAGDTSEVTTLKSETSDATTTSGESTDELTTEAPDTTETPMTERVYKTTDNISKLKIVGRASTMTAGLTSDWSGSGIEFSADCVGSVKVKVNTTGGTYYTVYVDGVRQSKRYFASGSVGLTIAENLPEGPHTFRIFKQSHIYHSMSVIESITLTGTLSSPPENKKHYIEFIGDSITCGYGVIFDKLESGVNYGTYEYADATRAFSFKTAELLNADYSLFSVSGWGITCGDKTIPQIYDKINWRRSSTEHDFVRKADIVVINLGTNDYSKSVGAANFMADGKAFINDIKAKNDNPVIIWVYNMMNDGYQSSIRQIISEMGGESAGLYTLSLLQNRKGGGSHPSLEGHDAAATTIVNFIKDKNLLN